MSWVSPDSSMLQKLADFISEREYECMNFSSSLQKRLNSGKYLNILKTADSNIAVHTSGEGEIDFAILLTSSGQLLAAAAEDIESSSLILNPLTGLSLAGYTENRVNTIMGKTSAVNLIINSLPERSTRLNSNNCFDYYTMILEKKCYKPPVEIPGALFRKPVDSDFSDLMLMQEYYEKEEVLPYPELFNSGASEKMLRKIIKEQTVYIAEYRGNAAAKANTNVRGVLHEQIGGVYTLPEFRNLGISTALTGVMAESIFARGNTPSLFVKQNNEAAVRVYKKTGFTIKGDFRIIYQ